MAAIAVALVVYLFLPFMALWGQQPRHEQPPPHLGSFSFMELFSTLEGEFARALQRHDIAKLSGMSSAEFVIRSAADPQHTVTRSEWLEKVVPTYQIGSFQQREMSIRVFPGDVALVSFVQHQQANEKKENEGEFLVVDVWVGNHERRQWQLAQRYWAPVPRHSPARAN